MRLRFTTDQIESRALAESCAALIAAGIPANELMVLPANYRSMRPLIARSLDDVGVPYELSGEDGFVATATGRLVYALLRVVSSDSDYVALRTILGIQSGVGVKTCNEIADAVLTNNFNYRDLFYVTPVPFTLPTRASNALNSARSVVSGVAEWTADDSLVTRMASITAIVRSLLGLAASAEWLAYAGSLPEFLTLNELQAVLAAESDEQRRLIYESAFQRVGQVMPVPPPVPARVQVMTMHGAKGLSARVVFIPGLKESLMPGPRRAPYPGLVQEAARLLYVSVTRARAACVISYANRRFHNGTSAVHAASQLANVLGGAFSARTGSLTQAEVVAIAADCAAL